MSEKIVDYRPMWTELGLDLARHDTLLDVLGKMYQDLFLSQPNRPAGMKYFDFVMSEVHGLRIRELQDARQAGRRWRSARMAGSWAIGWSIPRTIRWRCVEASWRVCPGTSGPPLGMAAISSGSTATARW